MTKTTDPKMLSRRMALARIGLAAGAVYVAPTMLGANAARASGGNSGGNSGNSGNSRGNSGNSRGNSGNSRGNSRVSWGNGGRGSLNNADVTIALQRLLGL